MRKIRFRDEQILGGTAGGGGGPSMEELWRRHGISQVNEPRRLSQVEEENHRFKRVVAHQALNLQT